MLNSRNYFLGVVRRSTNGNGTTELAWRCVELAKPFPNALSPPPHGVDMWTSNSLLYQWGRATQTRNFGQLICINSGQTPSWWQQLYATLSLDNIWYAGVKWQICNFEFWSWISSFSYPTVIMDMMMCVCTQSIATRVR